MIYSDAIRDGFRLVNSRWQLIVVQTVMMLFNCIGFFIIVGIPLGVAFIIFGLDLTGLSQMNDVLALLKNPAEILSKYFGLILMVVACLLFYILMVSTAGLYVFGGSVGVLGRAVQDPSQKFSMRDFFADGRRLFFPMMWYSVVAGIVFLIITFGLGIFGGGIAAIVSAAKGQDSTLALFLGIFFSMVLALTGLCLILGALAVTVYGIAVLYYRRDGAVRSFTSALRFLRAHPQAFWLYVVLLSGYIMVSFLVMLIVYPFYLIPILGTLISFPFHIAQSYLGLIILTVVLNYYYTLEMKGAGPGREQEEGPAVMPDEGSMSPADTSPSPADTPGPVPHPKDDTGPN
ncbi:MAG: hypothetical protein HZB33_07590 [Nitrospirae bacterium]|nr:hypothetical protein [Nitrospirota bacterium]